MQNDTARDVKDQLIDADSPLGVLIVEMKIQTFDRATK